MAIELVKVQVQTKGALDEHIFNSDQGDVFIDGSNAILDPPDFGHLVIRYEGHDGYYSGDKCNKIVIYPTGQWESLTISKFPIS